MSRGPGKRQRLLLERVKKLKPGDPNRGTGWFYLSTLVDEQYTELSTVRPATKKAVVGEAFRRAAQELAASGQLRAEKAGRDLVIKPTHPQKPNTYEFADEPVSNAYLDEAPNGIQDPVSVGNGRLSVGLEPVEAETLLWAIELVLSSRGVCSQGDRDRLQRVRPRLKRVADSE